MDRIVDTHRRFHGDPATESLNHISQEVSLSKRSMTPLMKAAARDDLETISELLAAGALIDEQDASGWTPLMYAAGSYAEAAVSALLKAGADPNHTDFAGRTPLMASVNGLGYEEILIAVRSVNGQSQSGLTALMLMAKGANSERVRHALANGADPTLTDAAGQSAWDYLMQSYCGRILSPSPSDPPQDVSADDAQQCFELDRLLKLPVR
jgi:ankyrin repeat protein